MSLRLIRAHVVYLIYAHARNNSFRHHGIMLGLSILCTASDSPNVKCIISALYNNIESAIIIFR